MNRYWFNMKPKPNISSYVPSFGQTLHVSGKYVLIFQLEWTITTLRETKNVYICEKDHDTCNACLIWALGEIFTVNACKNFKYYIAITNETT